MLLRLDNLHSKEVKIQWVKCQSLIKWLVVNLRRLAFFVIVIFIGFWSGANAQISPKKQALKLFDEYSSKIEKNQEMKLIYRRAIVGDLNKDGLNDAIVEFGLGAKEGMKTIQKEAAIYINKGDKMKVIGEFAPSYCPKVEAINDGIVTVKKLATCINPNPEVLATWHYALKGNELIRVAYSNDGQ